MQRQHKMKGMIGIWTSLMTPSFRCRLHDLQPATYSLAGSRLMISFRPAVIHQNAVIARLGSSFLALISNLFRSSLFVRRNLSTSHSSICPPIASLM
jgi:hypothetical protein